MDEIEKLKAELAGLTDQARTLPLLRLGKEYMDRFWRTGPLAPAARPAIEGCVNAIKEALGYLHEGDPLGVTAGAMLGIAYAWRSAAYGDTGNDVDEGIRLLAPAVESPLLKAGMVMVAKPVLGQLYASRAIRGLVPASGNMLAAARTGPPAEAAADVERATECFQAVLAMPTPPEVTASAQAMLTMTDSLRTLLSAFGSGPLGVDLSKVMAAFTTLQQMQQNRGDFPGWSAWHVGKLLDLDVIDRPVVIVEGRQPTEEYVMPTQEPLAVDVEAMRRELRELVPEGSLVQLLRSAEVPKWIDEFVALATGVVYGTEQPSGTDHLLLAAGLFLRGRRDDSSGDAEAAAESVRTAAGMLPPDSIPVLLFLATLLPGDALAGLGGFGPDVIVFPEPVRSLRWNTDRFEPTDAELTAARVVIVGDDPAPDYGDCAVSHVASLAQLNDLARRTIRPVGEQPVFIANPRGDRVWAMVETMVIRRSCYPNSVGFGQLAENANGPGRANEVIAALGASLLHIDCGITASGSLELADGTELDLTTVTVEHGGLVILPPERFLPLADVLLAAGYTGVIGWRHPVPEATAALATYVLHTELTDRGRTPAEAVRETHRWYHNPDKDMLPSLLTGYAAQISEIKQADWMSLTHRGR